jgi:hypothetical protein
MTAPAFFRLLEDDDGHWYVVPEEFVNEFDDWVDYHGDIIGDGIDTEWVGTDFEQYRVGRPSGIRFKDWEIA